MGAPALACGRGDRCNDTGCADNRDGRRSAHVSTTRAVVRGVEPGNDVRCVRCGKQIKFAARTHPRQVIANVYLDGAWNRVDHFHEECYLDAGEPYGQIDTLGGPFTG
jgi:hypothetical protein